MARVLGLMLLIVGLGAAGYAWVVQSRSLSPSSPAITQAEGQARSAVSGTNFRSADSVLQAWFAEHGTYAGATLPPGTGVVLVRADAGGYCLQDGTAHELGPNGQPQPGAC